MEHRGCRHCPTSLYTGNLPFRPILTLQAHAIFLIRDAHLLVQFHHASAKAGLALPHGLVVHPDVVAPCLCYWVVGSVVQALGLGYAACWIVHQYVGLQRGFCWASFTGCFKVFMACENLNISSESPLSLFCGIRGAT